MRCRHGATGPGQAAKTRGDASLCVTGFGRGHPQGVEDHVAGGRATPAMYVRAPPPALPDCVIATLKELRPAPVEFGKQVGFSRHSYRVVHDVAHEGLRDHDLMLGVPIGFVNAPELPLHLLDGIFAFATPGP